MVRKAGGKVVTSVTKDLDFLVLGDEGSERYGADNKVVRVARLQEEGHKVRGLIESEFLRMFGVEYGTF
jgi:hypothetical protein